MEPPEVSPRAESSTWQVACSSRFRPRKVQGLRTSAGKPPIQILFYCFMSLTHAGQRVRRNNSQQERPAERNNLRGSGGALPRTSRCAASPRPRCVDWFLQGAPAPSAVTGPASASPPSLLMCQLRRVFREAAAERVRRRLCFSPRFFSSHSAGRTPLWKKLAPEPELQQPR
ncbi:hypothetical protein H8959_011472 [Pygathrix nigripes]